MEGATVFLAECFCAGIPTRDALNRTLERYGTVAWDTPAAQAQILQRTLRREDDLRASVPDFRFGAVRTARFIRLLLDEMDHCRADADEGFVEHAAERCLRTPATPARDGLRYVVLPSPGPDGDMLLRVGDTFSALGLKVWEAGVWLAAAIPTLPLRNKRVVELAAGTGLSAAALKHVGVSQAWLTDLDRKEVMDNLRHNVRINGADDIIDVRPLDICEHKESDNNKVRAVVDELCVDVLLAADITYDLDLAVDVTKAIKSAIENTARTAWIIATCRNDQSFSNIPKIFRDNQLDFKNVTTQFKPPKPRFYTNDEWDRIQAWIITDKVNI